MQNYQTFSQRGETRLQPPNLSFGAQRVRQFGRTRRITVQRRSGIVKCVRPKTINHRKGKYDRCVAGQFDLRIGQPETMICTVTVVFTTRT